VKEGALSVDGLTSYANTNIFIGANNQSLEIKPGSKGSVSAAGYTTLDVVGANGTLYTPKDLEVGGQVRAGQYCDENGENCLTGGGPSGGTPITYSVTVRYPQDKSGSSATKLITSNAGFFMCALTTHQTIYYETFGSDNLDEYCKITYNGSSDDWTLTGRIVDTVQARITCTMTCR